MKSNAFRALALAASVMIAGCSTTTTYAPPSHLEKIYYAGCATSPPENPTCGHH